MNLAAIGNDDVLRVRCKREPGQHIARRSGFLIVALHGILQPLLFAGRKIPDTQTGFRILARTEHELASIGRDYGTERRARRTRDHVFVTADPVTTDDLPDRKTRVVSEVAGPPRIVEVFPIR